MTDASAVAQDHLRSFVERILRAREAEDEAKADTKEIYKELAGQGYDKTAMGRLVAEIRAKAKNGDRVDELDALLDLYREAYHARRPHTHEASR